jgi:hypothetical protein
MIFYKTKNIIVANLLFATIFSYNSYSQYDDNYYMKFGVSVASDFIKTENENNAVSYKYKDIKTYNFGLHYKLLREKYNITFSLDFRNFNLTDTFVVKKEDIDSQYNFGLDETLYGFAQYKVKTTYNKYFLNRKRTNFYVGIGPELIIYDYDPIEGAVTLTYDEIGFTEAGVSKKSGLYLGINGNLGFQLKTKYFIFNPYILYHYQPENLFENVVTTQNLLVSKNTISKHNIKGSYLSLGIVFYPKKISFKK